MLLKKDTFIDDKYTKCNVFSFYQIVATLKKKVPSTFKLYRTSVRWAGKELIENMNTHYILFEQFGGKKLFILSIIAKLWFVTGASMLKIYSVTLLWALQIRASTKGTYAAVVNTITGSPPHVLIVEAFNILWSSLLPRRILVGAAPAFCH